MDDAGLIEGVSDLVNRAARLSTELDGAHRLLDALDVPREHYSLGKMRTLDLPGRIRALSRQGNRPILPLPRHVQQQLTPDGVPEKVRVLAASDILSITARHFGYNEGVLLGRERLARVTRPRQVAMYLIREHTLLTYPSIGRIFKRDHSTIQYGVNRIREALRLGDGSVCRAVAEIEVELGLKTPEEPQPPPE